MPQIAAERETAMRVNDRCACGSGKKFKKCCGCIIKGAEPGSLGSIQLTEIDESLRAAYTAIQEERSIDNGRLHVMTNASAHSDIFHNPPKKDETYWLMLRQGMPMPYYVPQDYRPWLGRCHLMVHGWDAVRKPLWLIPEAQALVRDYLAHDPAFPALLEYSTTPSSLVLLCTIAHNEGGLYTDGDDPMDKATIGIGMNTVKAIGDLLFAAGNKLVNSQDDQTAYEWLSKASPAIFTAIGFPDMAEKFMRCL